MQIKVEIEKHGDGDSTVVVTVNGETVDLKDIDFKMLEHGDDHVYIKKIKHTGKAGERKTRIIKKEINTDN